MQKHKRFASKKDGIIAVDDSTFEKTGKKMAHHIDLPKKRALLQFIDQCDHNDVLPDLIDVAGHHLEPKTLNAIDIKNMFMIYMLYPIRMIFNG